MHSAFSFRAIVAPRAFCAPLAWVIGTCVPLTLHAAPLPFTTPETGQYMIIGMGPTGVIGNALTDNSFELGANKAPVPSTSSFLNGGGSGGPSLLGTVPNIPLSAKPVATGILGGGDIAITHAQGVFNLQNVGVYGTLGVRTAQSAAGANNGTQNSFFNDPNQFPNTFTSTGFTNPGVNNNTGGFGNTVGPGQAVQSTRMDNNGAGVTGNQNFSALLSEINTVRTTVPTLTSTGSLNTSGSGGQIQNQTVVYNLNSGLNVIDIITGGSDFKLDNSTLVIDGPADAKAIFRVPDHANFLISNSNVLIGNGGIDEHSVMFYSDRQDNNQHFNFSNTVLSGIAFWTVGGTGGEIKINNAQGCVQLVGDKVTLNDVRFGGCTFDLSEVPEPTGLAPLALAWVTTRRRRRD